MTGRLHRRTRRRVVTPPPPEVECYFGPATVEVTTVRGSWAPRVDTVGLGANEAGCRLEVVMVDGEVRPTLPWWLRTTSPAQVTVHGVPCPTEAPAVRRRGRQTILRWTVVRVPGLLEILERARRLPGMLMPMLQRPPTVEERAVLCDYALSTWEPRLARWLGAPG
ncbi:MAG: hypothetical protein AAF602_18930 [Myxococcota bacterium]